MFHKNIVSTDDISSSRGELVKILSSMSKANFSTLNYCTILFNYIFDFAFYYKIIALKFHKFFKISFLLAHAEKLDNLTTRGKVTTLYQYC